MHDVLVHCRETDAQRVGYILVRLFFIVMHTDDTAGLRRQLLIDIVVDGGYQFIVVFRRREFNGIGNDGGHVSASCDDIEAAIADASKKKRAL